MDPAQAAAAGGLAFCLAGTAQLVLAMQLWGGFPPFYTKAKKPPAHGGQEDPGARMLRRALPRLAAGLPFFGLTVWLQSPAPLAGLGAACFWAGWAVRRQMLDEGRAPRGKLPRPPVSTLLLTRPMILFDVWSYGGAALVAALLLI